MKLPAYERTGRARFQITKTVDIQVQETIDTLEDPRGGLVLRLLRFIGEHELYPCRGGTSGGGFYCASHYVEDAEKIEAFLREQGAEVGEFRKDDR